MEASEQGTPDEVEYRQSIQQEGTQEEMPMPEEVVYREEQQQHQNNTKPRNDRDKGSFVHGLSVGLGMGCVATFVMVWIAIFFTPQLPSTLTYEHMLSVFVYPLVYLLAVGLVSLTAGIVREYYSYRRDL